MNHLEGLTSEKFLVSRTCRKLMPSRQLPSVSVYIFWGLDTRDRSGLINLRRRLKRSPPSLRKPRGWRGFVSQQP